MEYEMALQSAVEINERLHKNKKKQTKFEIEGREPTIVQTVHDKDNPYVMLNRKAVIDNHHLSFRARGLLSYMLYRPQGWKFNIKHLSSDKVTTEGRDAVQTALKELRDNGYVEDEYDRNEKGEIIGRRLMVYEIPKNGIPEDVVMEQAETDDTSHIWE